MKTFVTSDLQLHFGHANIMKFCPNTRKYKDVEDMNQSMIRKWNATVEPGDVVYILGDVAFMSGFDASKILARLNGDKILIVGNHDKKALKDTHFEKSFREIHQYHEIVYNGTMVIMCHYPFCEWNGMHRGSVALHGHLHGGKSGMETYRCRDVGMDATGKVVSLLDDVIADALKGEIKRHHH